MQVCGCPQLRPTPPSVWILMHCLYITLVVNLCRGARRGGARRCQHTALASVRVCVRGRCLSHVLGSKAVTSSLLQGECHNRHRQPTHTRQSTTSSKQQQHHQQKERGNSRSEVKQICQVNASRVNQLKHGMIGVITVSSRPTRQPRQRGHQTSGAGEWGHVSHR